MSGSFKYSMVVGSDMMDSENFKMYKGAVKNA
jgi:hypothetical protein